MIKLDDYPEIKRAIEEQLNKGRIVEVKPEQCGVVLSVVSVERKILRKDKIK